VNQQTNQVIERYKRFLILIMILWKYHNISNDLSMFVLHL